MMKNWIRRAGRTFVQTFCGTVSMGIVAAVSGATDVDALKTSLFALCASAVSAGIAAVMNLREEPQEGDEYNGL